MQNQPNIRYPWETRKDAFLYVDASFPGTSLSTLLGSSVIISVPRDLHVLGETKRALLFAVWHRETQFRLIGMFTRGWRGVVLHRCNDLCRVDLHPADGDAVGLVVHWAPTHLELALYGTTGPLRRATMVTGPTLVPDSLIRLCRDRQWISEPSYSSPSVLLQVVSEAFEQLSLPMRNAARVLRDGKEPKPEAQLSDMLGELLRHLDPVKRISLQREVQYGSGRVDLLASAVLDGGAVGRVCIEVKRSTHDDLEHGLEVQLPEYMKRAGTDYGLFVVIDFGPGYRPANRAKDGDLGKLAFLADDVNHARHLHIRVLILDGTPQPQPSKM